MSTRKNTSGHFKCCEDGTVLGAGFKGRHVWLLGWGGGGIFSRWSGKA